MKNLPGRAIIIIMGFALFFFSCSGGVASESDDADSVTLLSLPPELSAVSSNLSATLTVYSTTVTQIYHRSLSFVEIDDEDYVQSSSLTLKQGSHYRFVVVFYWNSEIFGYVDSVVQIPNSSSATIAYDMDDVVYDTDDPNSSISVPSLYEENTPEMTITELTVTRSDETGDLEISGAFTCSDTNPSASLTITDNNGATSQTIAPGDNLTGTGGSYSFSTTVSISDDAGDSVELRLTISNDVGLENSLTTRVSLL